MNLPTMNAHVCAMREAGFATASCRRFAPGHRSGCTRAPRARRAGARPARDRARARATSQTKPSAPVTMNAALPSPVQRDPRNNQRRDDRADVAPGVEDARRERALLRREPLRHRLDRAREVARLTESEQRARDRESRRRARERVRHRGEAPGDDRDREALAARRSDPGSARPEEAERVREAEPRRRCRRTRFRSTPSSRWSVGARMPSTWRSM